MAKALVQYNKMNKPELEAHCSLKGYQVSAVHGKKGTPIIPDFIDAIKKYESPELCASKREPNPTISGNIDSAAPAFYIRATYDYVRRNSRVIWQLMLAGLAAFQLSKKNFLQAAVPLLLLCVSLFGGVSPPAPFSLESGTPCWAPPPPPPPPRRPVFMETPWVHDAGPGSCLAPATQIEAGPVCQHGCTSTSASPVRSWVNLFHIASTIANSCNTANAYVCPNTASQITLLTAAFNAVKSFRSCGHTSKSRKPCFGYNTYVPSIEEDTILEHVIHPSYRMARTIGPYVYGPARTIVDTCHIWGAPAAGSGALLFANRAQKISRDYTRRAVALRLEENLQD